VHSDVVYVEGLAGNFYVERTFNIHRYREISEHLREFALNPRESVSLIHVRMRWPHNSFGQAPR
jgi:hypothetical protein